MNIVRTVFVTLLFAALTFAQQALTNDSVLKLVKAGMGDDLIISMVNSQPGNYSVTPEDLVSLKKAGVSEKVIGAMVMKNANPNPAPAAAAVATASPSGPVHEVGVYYKKAGVWTASTPKS